MSSSPPNTSETNPPVTKNEEIVLESCDIIQKLLLFWVKNFNICDVKKLLDSCYNMTDDDGNSLLHLSIIYVKRELFDYILSLDGFPLNAPNNVGATPLKIALAGSCPAEEGDDEDMLIPEGTYEYFATELIKKGAELYPEAVFDAVIHLGDIDVAELVLEKGGDPNVQMESNGKTCLHMLLETNFYDDDQIDFELSLLSYGADVLIEDRDGYSCLERLLTSSVERRDLMFDYVIDEHSKLKIHLDTLLKLALEGWDFFHRVLNQVEEILVTEFRHKYWKQLLLFEDGHFRDMEDKLWFFFIFVLLSSDKIFHLKPMTVPKRFGNRYLGPMKGIFSGLPFISLFWFIENNFEGRFVDFVSKIDSNLFFKSLLLFALEESTATKIVCFLLLHGLNLNQLDLQLVYKKYGYGELFKILLHMDFRPHNARLTNGYSFRSAYDSIEFEISKLVMPGFIYNVRNLDVNSYLKTQLEYSEQNIEELLHHFVHPRLTRYCEESSNEEFRLRVRNFPKVPLLKQLARDVTRKFLVKKLRIKNAKDFYTQVKHLPISEVYKRILTYETKLY